MYRKYRYLVPNIDIRIVRRNIAMHRYMNVSLHALSQFSTTGLFSREAIFSFVF